MMGRLVLIATSFVLLLCGKVPWLCQYHQHEARRRKLQRGYGLYVLNVGVGRQDTGCSHVVLMRPRG